MRAVVKAVGPTDAVHVMRGRKAHATRRDRPRMGASAAKINAKLFGGA